MCVKQVNNRKLVVKQQCEQMSLSLSECVLCVCVCVCKRERCYLLFRVKEEDFGWLRAGSSEVGSVCETSTHLELPAVQLL